MKNKKNIVHFLIAGLLLLSYNNIIASENEKFKALGGSIFVGHGLLTENISEHFTDPFFFGLNVDILRRKMVMQIDCSMGFGKTKKAMEFPNELEWAKNKTALHLMVGGNLGYRLINTEGLMLVPLAGIGVHAITSTFASSDESINEPLLPYYKVGCYIDIKSLKFFKNNDSNSYTCLRLGFGINSQIGTPKYESFYQGRMIYFTVGMGGLFRE